MRSLVIARERTLWAINFPPLWLVIAIVVVSVPIGWFAGPRLSTAAILQVTCGLLVLHINTARISLIGNRFYLTQLAGPVPYCFRRFVRNVSVATYGPDDPSVTIGNRSFDCAKPDRIATWLDERRGAKCNRVSGAWS
jgi:hypothetical protein